MYLPDDLNRQMKVYVLYRSRIHNSGKNEHLFIDFFYAKKEKIDNTKMFFILKDMIGSNCATALAKYAIIQMIKQGMPAHIIKDFTGYKDDIYNHCQEIVNEETGSGLKEEKCKIIDSKIRMVDLSDEF